MKYSEKFLVDICKKVYSQISIAYTNQHFRYRTSEINLSQFLRCRYCNHLFEIDQKNLEKGAVGCEECGRWFMVSPEILIQ